MRARACWWSGCPVSERQTANHCAAPAELLRKKLKVMFWKQMRHALRPDIALKSAVKDLPGSSKAQIYSLESLRVWHYSLELLACSIFEYVAHFSSE